MSEGSRSERGNGGNGLWWWPFPGRPMTIQEFLQLEASGGIVIFVTAIVAMIWANAFGDVYHDFWSEELRVGIAPFEVKEPLEGWVNDALMVVFFFVVSLEIKRELVHGELSDRRAAALPVLGAAGGMVLPAAIYFALNAGTEGDKGWGIPVATDIAFTLAVLALIGRRIPSGLRIFLLSLAIADDIGGILIIAAFYTADLDPGWLLAAGGLVAVILVLQRLGVGSYLVYVVVGVTLWFATHESGVHATIAGVALGLLTPAHPFGGRDVLEQLEDWVAPWAAFVVMPVFALANAGIEITAGALEDAFTERLAWGVVLGLVVGKTVGISIATFTGLRLGVGRLPEGVNASQVVGAAALAGIGFTVSLFIATLSFSSDPGLLEDAKLGVFAGSLVSGALGATILMTLGRTAEGDEAREVD
ncbi:MAG: Na+/H+ antiporter NhaA [Dehalococcoidia bacterium]